MVSVLADLSAERVLGRVHDVEVAEMAGMTPIIGN